MSEDKQKYLLKRKIGLGTNSTVFEAENLETKQIVAIKIEPKVDSSSLVE
jgi:hypothetical protein